ncbi:hypothetical protein [Agilicoccus flavus]|uniref:hypothetical protein n=1 Tax=Agilicoccus flavus TaxID=2775968 RepID=UPI001CF6F2CE|nr:hypothetical protein [Agilicoccus flavus]
MAIIAVTLPQVIGIALLIGTCGDAPLGAVRGGVLVTILDAIPPAGRPAPLPCGGDAARDVW